MSSMRSGDVDPVDAPPRSVEQGKYRVIASLGQGGMANILLAVMSGPARFNKLLVLKVLRDDLEGSRAELAAMFLDEARLAARLQHRNLVQTYEFGEIDGRYHMAMEYLEGQSLRALQQKHAPAGLPLAEELYILAQTARGLHHAHEVKGLDGVPLCVVHRDISPQNVFVTYAGEVKLLDFGIAKTVGDEHLTQVGVIKGKVDYIAPEQVRGEGVDRRADIFSLGAMLWEAITKDRFGGGIKVAEVTKFHKRLTGGERNVRVVKPDVPEALAAIVDRAIALDPDQRFATAEQFADSIEAYLAVLPTPPSERSVAALIVGCFADEREKLRKRIEQQIQRIQAKEPRSDRLSSGARTLDLTLTMSGVVDLSVPGSTTTARGDLPINLYSSAPKPGAVNRRVRAIAASGLALGVAVVSSLVGRWHDSPSAATQSAAAPAAAVAAAPSEIPTPPASAPPAAARTVSFKVDVSPGAARVTLDAVPLGRLPFVGSFQSTGEVHRLEASAAGFQSEKQLVVFDRDQSISIALRPSAAPSRAHVRHSVAATTTDVTPALPAPSPLHTASPHSEEPEPGAELKTRPRQRDFDTTDPYRN